MSYPNAICTDKDITRANIIRSYFFSYHQEKDKDKQFLPLVLEENEMSISPVSDLAKLIQLDIGKLSTLKNPVEEISSIDYTKYQYPINKYTFLTKILKKKDNVIVFAGRIKIKEKDIDEPVAIKFVKYTKTDLNKNKNRPTQIYLDKLNEMKIQYHKKYNDNDSKNHKNPIFPSFNEYYVKNDVKDKLAAESIYLNEGMQEILIYFTLYPHLFYGNLLIYDEESNACYTILIMKRLYETAYQVIMRYLSNIYQYKDIEHNFNKIYDLLAQLLFVTIPLSRNFGFRHNDCKLDNIGYSPAGSIKNIRIEIEDLRKKTKQYFKIPTRGKIFTLFDFGWSNFQISSKKIENSKIYNFYSSTPIHVFKDQQFMFLDNPCTDMIQMISSCIRLIMSYDFSERLSKSDRTQAMQETINQFQIMLTNIIAYDENYKHYTPISSLTEQMFCNKLKYVPIPHPRERWNANMYIPLSELCTYNCKKRQAYLLDFIEKYKMSDQDIITFHTENRMKQQRKYPYLICFVK